MKTNLIILGGTSVFINNKNQITLKNTFYDYLRELESQFDSVYWIVPNTSLFELNSIAKFDNLKVYVFNKSILGILAINLKLIFLSLKLKKKYILHFNSPFTFPSHFFLKKNTIKFISYVGIDYNEIISFDKLNKFPFWKSYYFYYLKTLLKNSDLLLARGKAIYNFCKKYNNNVFVTNYLGWNFKKKISYENFFKFNKEKKKITILFIGKIIFEKGIFDLLKIFQEIVLKYPDIKFYMNIVGDGKDKHILTKEISKIENIHYFGWIDSENKLLDIYNKSDLLICPTRPGYPEGVPRVIDEALSLYKLVIASKVGGIYQEFKENSPIIMFDGGSHSSLFQSIEQVIQNSVDLEQIYKNINLRLNNNISAAEQHVNLIKS